MAEKLYEEIQPLLCRLSKEKLVDICIATKAADYETIQAKSVCRLLNILNNFLEDSLDDESYSLSLLNSVKDACLKSLPLQVPSGGSQGDEAQVAEGGSSSLPAVDTERRGNEGLTLSSQTPAEQSPQVPVNSNTLNLFKRELKIAGTIADSGNKDKLSFCGLIRQINSAVSRGYSETEIIEAVIRAISPGNLLREYLESMQLSDLSLAKLSKLLRSHYKGKSASELFQDLMNAVQQPKEDSQSFLMRLLNIRQKFCLLLKSLTLN